MVHLKRTTSSTSPHGITTYTTIIPKAPYNSAPQDLRRSFRHELIDDCFPNVSQHHGWYETGGKARRINDWLDGESDREHERGVAREMDGRIRRGRRGGKEDEEMAEDGDFDGDGEEGGSEGEETGEEDGEEEEEQNDDESQNELEQQLRRESGVGGLAMGVFTNDEGNTPQFMEQMRQHISTSPPAIPTISAETPTLAHVSGRSAQIERGIRARGGRGRGRERGARLLETKTQTEGSYYVTPSEGVVYPKEEAASEYQDSPEFLATVASHSSSQDSPSSLTEMREEEEDKGKRREGKRERGSKREERFSCVDC